PGARRISLRFDPARTACFRSGVRAAAHRPGKYPDFSLARSGTSPATHRLQHIARTAALMLLPSEEEGAMPNGYEVMTEFSPETEQFEDEQFEFGGAEIFGEAQQMELAMELLEVRDEAELDRFLGSLISSAGRALGKVVRSPVGRAIG